MLQILSTKLENKVVENCANLEGKLIENCTDLLENSAKLEKRSVENCTNLAGKLLENCGDLSENSAKLENRLVENFANLEGKLMENCANLEGKLLVLHEAKDCKDRWKNIRCSYSKNKRNMSAPSGSAAKTPKEYYLAPNLRFLDSFLKSRPSKGNLGNDADRIEDEDDLTCMSAGSPAGERQATDFITPQHSQPPPKNKQIRISDVNKTAHEYFTLKNKQIIARQQNMDEGTKVKNKDDMAFFRSMMPDVQTMNQDQKRKLKLGVLNLIEQILKEPITSRISCPRSITPYQRTPSRESEYNSPANVGSYGSPTGSYGNQSPQQTHTSDAYGGLTLQQTHTTSGYGGLTLQQTQPTLQQIQPTLQQTQTTGHCFLQLLRFHLRHTKELKQKVNLTMVM
ncbi:unnamed protein product [Acanthoscelides obtectus]|uniref:BESS domain-containing protein n=1 Tax=Acanthoscelides obtectus TaxID=200917 RepID=A0A9P0K553_ACAOB|nr:unnamed protein product [Acanthoscelides obtectus]CAK1633798.1 hypothetical protein AOBTE_LOCUS8396 [Acanthoscelides obtectus]